MFAGPRVEPSLFSRPEPEPPRASRRLLGRSVRRSAALLARAGRAFGMLGIHAGQGGPNEFGTRFAACFIRALDDAQLPPDPEFRSVMRRFITAATTEVNSYSPPGTRLEPDLPMPRWSWDGPQT